MSFYYNKLLDVRGWTPGHGVMPNMEFGDLTADSARRLKGQE
jgi:hypothetical protein